MDNSIIADPSRTLRFTLDEVGFNRLPKDGTIGFITFPALAQIPCVLYTGLDTNNFMDCIVHTKSEDMGPLPTKYERNWQRRQIALDEERVEAGIGASCPHQMEVVQGVGVSRYFAGTVCCCGVAENRHSTRGRSHTRSAATPYESHVWTAALMSVDS